MSAEHPHFCECAAAVLGLLAGAIVVLLLMTACSAPFEAQSGEDLSTAGVGGHPQTLPQAGASGGQAESTGGATGNPDAAIYTVRPCDRSSWVASAFASWTAGDGGPPSSALDAATLPGTTEPTRWTSGADQAAGQWFEVELGTPAVLVGLTLRSERVGDMPPAVAVELNGAAIPASATSSPGVLELSFAPTRASSARLVLDEPASAWWSIDELEGACQ